MPDVADNEIEGFLRSHGPFEKPPSISSGERIGDWKVLAFLGRGGSAEVYRAENVVTGIVGAVKVLYRADDRSRERFRRETRLLAETKSPAFPMFYGAGESDGHLYIAEELLEPIAFPSTDAAVARLILGIATGVEELHRRGFVHRDLKPGNVLTRPSTGEYVLIDMGLAKESEDTSQVRNDTLSVVDGRAVGVGTPGFSAPEQFTGGRVGAAMDIHALGMLANVCFGGKPPKAWIAIIRRSTSSIPEQRYASVADFMRAVRRRHAARRWIIVILAAFIAIFTIFCFFPRGDRPFTRGDRPQVAGDRPQDIGDVRGQTPANRGQTPRRG
jgi:serine/threonine protein kinase